MRRIFVLLALVCFSDVLWADIAKPRVLVYIQGQRADLVAGVVEEVFLGAGYRIVDRDQLKNIKKVDAAIYSKDRKKLLALKHRYGVEVIFAGKVRLELQGVREIYGRSYRFYNIRCSFKAIVVDTAQVIWSKAYRKPSVSSMRFLMRMAKKGAREAAKRIGIFWKKASRLEGEFEVVISKISYPQVVLFEAFLKGVKRVKAAVRRSYLKQTAIYEITFRGRRVGLERVLLRCGNPSLKIVRSTANRVEAEVGKKVVVADGEAPKIRILYPPLGQFFREATLTILGEVKDKSPLAGVVVQGKRVLVSKGKFVFLARLKEGRNTILVKARDVHGNVGRFSFYVFLDTKAPRLEVFRPREGAVVKGGEVLVAGRVVEENLKYVKVNGFLAQMTGNGNFVCRLLLGKKRVIRVEAEDKAGNRAILVRRLRTDVVGPVISWVSPPLEGVVVRSFVEVILRVVDDSGVGRVLVQGEEAEVLGNGLYKARVKLAPGLNRLKVEAWDRYGNGSTSYFSLRRRVVPLRMKRLAPASLLVSSSETWYYGMFNQKVLWAEVNGQRAQLRYVKRPKGVRTFFQVRLRLREGRNPIWIRAKGVESEGSWREELVLDATPPRLEVSSPKSGSWHNRRKVLVRGRVEDEHFQSMSANGEVVALQEGGRFEFWWDLGVGEGLKEVRLEARDRAGNRVVEWLRVHLDTRAPRVEVRAPLPGVRVSRREVKVMARVEEENLAQVWVNGKLARYFPRRGVFGSLLVFSTSGKKRIEVVARDKAGNVAKKEFWVEVDLVPLKLSLVRPQRLLVGQSQVWVEGVANKRLSELRLNKRLVSFEFREGRSYFRVRVALKEGKNLLQLWGRDFAGREVEVRRWLELDSRAPRLEFLFPVQDAHLNKRKVRVVGKVEDPHLKSVLVNGKYTRYRKGKFAAILDFPKDGRYRLRVRAEDTLGNVAERVRTVVIDTKAPVLSIRSPASGLRLNRRKIAVLGTVQDENLAEVRVNGVSAKLLKKGGFLAYVRFAKDGEHWIRVVARDRAGNTSSREVKINIDTRPPSVSFVVEIQGKVDKPGSRVWVNGQEVKVDKGGRWRAKIDIMRVKVIEIVAQDPNGNITRTVRKLGQ
ncbi:MAG: hypothetical protein D6805_04925 [Planctomycetota bacterium]|nr:MAG: hypothetical protein D6805_04925 [Planctomycetota bacterium]